MTWRYRLRWKQLYLIVRKLFDSEDQAYGSGVIVVYGAYVSSAVGLEEVLVAGGYIGHALFDIGILAEIRRWCAPEPVGFVAAPAAGEVRDVVLRFQVHTEQWITIVVERQVSVLFRFRQRVFAKLLGGREPQGRF